MHPFFIFGEGENLGEKKLRYRSELGGGLVLGAPKKPTVRFC